MTRPSQFLVLGLLALVWGSSFILMKKGLLYFAPDQLAALRMTIAMAVLLPIALKNLAVLRGKLVPLFAIGLIGNVVPAFLFAVAQTEVPSAVSGMLNSVTSLFTLVLGVAFFRLRVATAQVAGVFIALAGTLGLIGFSHVTELTTYGRFSLLIVAATGCYGLAINLIKAYVQELRPHHITSLAYLLAAPLLTLYLFAGTDFAPRLASEPGIWRGVLYVALLGVFSTSLAVILFNRLVQATTPLFASSVTYLIPVVAVGWGVSDGESVDLSQFGYLLLILVGIYLINRSPNKRAAERGV